MKKEGMLAKAGSERCPDARLRSSGGGTHVWKEEAADDGSGIISTAQFEA